MDHRLHTGRDPEPATARVERSTDGAVSVTIAGVPPGRFHLVPAGPDRVVVVDGSGGQRLARVARDGAATWVHLDGRTWRFEEAASTGRGPAAALSGEIRSPLTGKLVRVAVAVGDRVRKGQVVAAVEAMKMEQPLPAPFDGSVREVRVAAGRQVDRGEVLLTIEPEESADVG